MWFQEADRIIIVPIGKVQWWLLEEVSDAFEPAFPLPASVIEAVPFPYELVVREREQIRATDLIGLLASRGLKGLVTGIIDYDIFASGLEYLFGEADPVEGISVVSIARFREEFFGREPDQALLRNRLVKEALHEMGHLYSLRHCPEKTCIMHFSGDVEITDQKTESFCPDCRGTLKEVMDGGYQTF